MIYIGIDPGKSGAMAAIDEEGRVFALTPFDEEQYRAISNKFKPEACKCCLEKVNAMPGQGVTSMFTFGQNYGWIQGVLYTRRISYQLVPPRTWKREFSLTGDKADSIAVCKQLFPTVSLKRTERSRTDDNNIAEALLMAEYARRHF